MRIYPLTRSLRAVCLIACCDNTNLAGVTANVAIAEVASAAGIVFVSPARFLVITMALQYASVYASVLLTEWETPNLHWYKAEAILIVMYVLYLL